MDIGTQLASNIISLGLGGVAILISISNMVLDQKRSKRDREYNNEQAIQERRHQNRPIIIPAEKITHPALESGKLDSFTTDRAKLAIQTGGVSWELKAIQIGLSNIGNGPGLNVSYIFNSNNHAHGTNERFLAWDRGPIAGGGSSKLYGEHDENDPGLRDFCVDGNHSLSINEPVGYHACGRLTITYHDLFGIIHVSIFDYIQLPSSEECEWRYVNIQDGVEHDVKEFYTNKDLRKQLEAQEVARMSAIMSYSHP